MPDHAHQPSSPRSAPTASTGGGFDVKTLFLTACASAAAAYASSKLWAPGTLAAAAFTPVLVAILKEALAKPTDAVARAVPVRGVLRSARPEGPQAPAASWSAAPGGEHLGDDRAAFEPAQDPAARVAQPGEIQYHGTGRRMRGRRRAVVTGLLGFLICAVVFTVPELLAGGSAAGGGRDTTIFGGGKDNDRTAPADTKTTTIKTRTVISPPATTVEVPPPVTVTTPPSKAAPAPAATTPAPPEPEPAPDPAEPAVPAPPAAQPPS